MMNDLGPSMNNFTPTNYRSADIFSGNYPLQTPSGIVHTNQPSNLPPLPPRPQSLYQQQPSMFGNNSFNSYGSSFGSGFGYGMGGGMGGMGGFGSLGSYGSYGGGFNRGFGGMPLDPESRFIQMAEETSRGAFQSIEQVVSVFGNIATMLDSTYFALTSSFRAILGLAANFSQMRGFLTKFFSSLTIFRTAIWIYRKFLYILGVSKRNPSMNANLSEAFKEAEVASSSSDFFNAANQQSGGSGLSMVLFLAFIFSAPYLIMKIFGSVMNSAEDKTKHPASWINPIDAIVMYNFNGENQSELTLKAGQHVKIAPREVQQINRLLSTNWVLATVDGIHVGLVPVNYIKRLETSQLPSDDTVADVTMEPVLLQQETPQATSTTTLSPDKTESSC